VVVEKEKVVGILSKRNFTRKMILKKKKSKKTLVRDIMTAKVIQTTPNQKVDKCLSLMTKNRFRHIPVLEKDRLVGILSIEDIKSIL
jgi:CBS domain-containing protein